MPSRTSEVENLTEEKTTHQYPGFIQAGHLCKYRESCFHRGHCLVFRLFSNCGHILHNDPQSLSLSHSQRHKQETIALGMNTLLEFISTLHPILSLSISPYGTLF